MAMVLDIHFCRADVILGRALMLWDLVLWDWQSLISYSDRTSLIV
jgi:hypothetical protein